MTVSQSLSRAARWAGRGGVLLVLAGGVVLSLLWLAGTFETKVPSTGQKESQAIAPLAQHVVPVRSVRLPLTETAVGTMRAVHETTIGSKLLARVVELNLKAGQQVKKGEVLVRLDDSDLRARLKQAEAALTSAEAARAQAQADADRYESLLKSNAVSRQEYERAATAVKSTGAELRRAAEAINEMQATLDFATIRSPMDGIVIDKKVDTGDLVTPGQTLATLLDPNRMQLVASVRESLAHRLEVGQSINVQIEALNKQCTGIISEIVPESQSASRTFQVKVTGPCPKGVYSGMFARLLIPLDEEQVLVVPREAVQSVGQLELVDVVDDGRISRRAVRAGRRLDDDIEILSGLREGEQVALPPPLAELQSEATDG
ncbi:MAG: efflux RND transporter periplasmic adaptor subunit [Pirellulales bacterium]